MDLFSHTHGLRRGLVDTCSFDLVFFPAVRFGQGLRQSTHLPSQSLVCPPKTRRRPYSWPTPFLSSYIVFLFPPGTFSPPCLAPFVLILPSGCVKTMQGPQETEKTTGGVLQTSLVEEPTLVDLNTPQKMVGKLLPFIQLSP